MKKTFDCTSELYAKLLSILLNLKRERLENRKMRAIPFKEFLFAHTNEIIVPLGTNRIDNGILNWYQCR